MKFMASGVLRVFELDPEGRTIRSSVWPLLPGPASLAGFLKVILAKLSQRSSSLALCFLHGPFPQVNLGFFVKLPGL